MQILTDGFPVPEGSEPLVERDGGLPIVAFEVVVVQVVEVRPAMQNAVEPAVAAGRRECRVLRVEEKVHGMARHDEVYEHDREVQ